MPANNIDDKSFPKTPVPLTVDQRKQLGREKKLWRMEILFEEHHQNQVCRYFIDNKTGTEIIEFREKMFSIGLMVMADPGHWVLIPPSAVIQVDIWKQDKFYDVQ